MTKLQRGLLAIAFLGLTLGEPPQLAAQICVGDCDASRDVTVDELVRGVTIALGDRPLGDCVPFNVNGDAVITVDELVAGVNSALEGCYRIRFRGTCRRPGPNGLVNCAAGSAIRLSLCLDRDRCLFDASARRLLRSTVAGADASFDIDIRDASALESLLLLEADVAPGVVYRTITFGPLFGSTVDSLIINPFTEAIGRIFIDFGLNRFTDTGIRELITLILNAIGSLSLNGATPENAVQLVLNAAQENATVQAAIATRQFTPTPTFSPSLTPTLAVSATPTLSPTITQTFTSTPTPTSTPTATPSNTFTSTPSQTPTPTSTPTRTPTSTETVSPTATPTRTVTNSPTATLPPLNLQIEVNPDPARPGETLEVSFTVTNTGGSAINGLSLQTVLPNRIQSFSDSLTGIGRCGIQQINTCDPGSTLTFTLFTIAPGQGVTVRMPPILAPGTPNGSQVTFTGTVQADGGLTTMSSYSVEVQSATPFDLALTQESDPVERGSLLTYTIPYGYRALVGQAANSVLQFELPAGTTFVSATDGGMPTEEGVVEWALGTILPGDIGTRRVTVQVSDSLPSGALLNAQAVIRRGDGTGEKRANAASRIVIEQPIKVAIETNPDPVRPGESVEVSMTLTNTSNSAATVLLNMVVPDFVDTFLDVISTGGGFCGPFSLGNPCARRERISWSVTVPARDGVTVRLAPLASMSAQSGALLHFQARVLTAFGGFIQATARRAVHVDAAPSWELAVDEDRDPVGPSEGLTYRIYARHRPAAPAAANAVLTFQLPAGVSLEDASDDGMLTGDTVEWELGPLSSSEWLRRDVTVRVDDEAENATLLTADAVVRDAGVGGDESRFRVNTRVVFGSTIQLALDLHPDGPRAGEYLETEISVGNIGAGGTSIDVETIMPDGTEPFPTAQSANVECVSAATILACVPRQSTHFRTFIASGVTTTFRMPPRVAPATADGTALRVYVGVLSSVGGSTQVSRTVIVDNDAPFDLAIDDSRDPAGQGQPLTYTIHYGRPGSGTSSATRLRAYLPPQVFFASASGGGVQIDDTTVEWDLGAVASGEGGSREVNVLVDSLALEGTLMQARAIIVTDGDPVSEKRAYATTAIRGMQPLRMTLAATPDPASPGQMVLVTMSVTNNGAGMFNNLRVDGIVAPEVNAFADTSTTGGGICGPFSTNSCTNLARVIFSIPTVGAGQMATLTMPPVVRANLPPGSVVRFVGWMQRPTQDVSLATDSIVVD